MALSAGAHLSRRRCQVGDNVLLPEYGGTNIVLGKKAEDEFIMYREGDILGTFAK